ncbi:DUF4191 family protein, partial [Streptomyces aurantiacus]|uniref:DUF4191 family protein n=1 Tax=Streptomyces aurantiacus TaxID=47760 RepID=UPI00131A203A
KMARIVADVPVHDVIVGNGEGQVELKKLRTTLLKLPRVLQGPQVTATNDRLKCGDAAAVPLSDYVGLRRWGARNLVVPGAPSAYANAG